MGLLSIVFVIVAIAMIPLVFSLAGGQGKAKGNSCMAQCMKVEAEYYDASKELTQDCQVACNVGTGQGSCLTSDDGCCVPYTDDPDCVSTCTDVTIHVQDSSGPLSAKVWIYQGTTELFGPQLTDENGDTTFCLEDGSNYRAKAELINGDISMSGYFTVSGTSFTVTITY